MSDLFKAAQTEEYWKPRLMPDLTTGTYAYQHNIHSAIVVLDKLGIRPARISIVMDGRQSVPDGTVVRQTPAPGAELMRDTLIELRIAGAGFAQHLPMGMWDRGNEAEPGTRELLMHIDDPLCRLRHWFSDGAQLFHLSPDDTAACVRWLTMFGFDCDPWPQHFWYPLATLAARLPLLSCSEEGLRTAFDLLFELPVRSLRYQRSLMKIPDPLCSSFGERASRLGVDLVAGDELEGLARLEIEIGPVSLNTYRYFVENEEGVQALERAMRLLMPLATEYAMRWLVGDPSQPPRLGQMESNSLLGINSHMGGATAFEENHEVH